MSSKTVKVTNGKIVNYTITAPGYKTINGSQLITADTTINKNMISEADPNGVYSLGDRIGGIASFVTYYTDSNGNQYAVFVADAKYRTRADWGPSYTDTDLPNYTDANALKTEVGNLGSATQYNNYIMSTYYPSGSTSNPYPAFKAAADIDKIVSFGTSGIGRLPNPYELYKIYQSREFLDSKDPTVSDYSTLSLSVVFNGTNINNPWSCYENGGQKWSCHVSSNDLVFATVSSNNSYPIIPVFEIPVN